MASRPRDPESRIQVLEAVLEDDPVSPAFFPLASLIWEKGEADKAIGLLTGGLQHHSAYAAPRVLLGEIYLAKEQVSDAAGELEKAIARVPWNLAAQRLLLDCCRKLGDEAGARRAQVAIGMFDIQDEAAAAALEGPFGAPGAASAASGAALADEAPLEETGDAVPTPSLAELYISQGHPDKALEVYQSLAEEDPANMDYLEKITDLREQIGQVGEAPAGAVESGDASEIEDFDSILDEAGGDTGAEALAPEAAEPASAAEPEAGGEVDDLDALFGDEPEETAPAAAPAAEAPAADQAADSGGGDLDDLDALFADEPASPPATAPAAETPAADQAADSGGGDMDDLDALFADEPEKTVAPEAGISTADAEEETPPSDEVAEPAGDGDELDAMLAQAMGEPPPAAEAPAVVDAEGEPGAAEAVSEEGLEEAPAGEGGAFEDLDSLFEDLSESPASAVETPAAEAPVAEDTVDTVDTAAVPDPDGLDAMFAEELGESPPAAEAPEADASVVDGEDAGVDLPAADAVEAVDALGGDGGDLDALFEEELGESPPAAEAPEADASVADAKDAGVDLPGADAADALGGDGGDLDALFEEELGVPPPAAETPDANASLVDEEDAGVDLPAADAVDAVDASGRDDGDLDAMFEEELGVPPPVAEAPEVEASVADEEDAGVDLPAVDAVDAMGGDGGDLDALFEEELGVSPPAAEAPEADASLAEVGAEPAEEVEAVTSGVDLFLESVVFEEEEDGPAEVSPSLPEGAAGEEPGQEPVETSGPPAAAGVSEAAGDAQNGAPDARTANPAEEMLRGIIEIYVLEENFALALDVCQKAEVADPDSVWLGLQIQELEARISESGEGDLLRPSDGVMEEAVSSSPMHSSEVVKSLEGWLKTIERRKGRLSASPQGEAPDESV
ncbi:MAG: hypothetical protein VCF07_19300 [Nitrospinota bacterium]